MSNVTDARPMQAESSETCHADETERIYISWQDGRRITIHVIECSECGQTYEYINGNYEFCPHCGRMVLEMIDYEPTQD